MDYEKRLRQINKYILRMPSLSTTVGKVLEICNNPATSPNDLNRVISLDPVLTGQVLRLINSAYYSLPNRITSLTRAIIMLGINTVKNLVLGTSIIGSLGGRESFKSLSMDNFWEHSLAVGVTAKALAVRKGIPITSREEFFVAGLLHDLGKIPLNNRFPDEYSNILNQAAQRESLLSDVEKEIIGFDHGIVGGMIADKWQLTPTLKNAMGHHHSPQAADENCRTITSYVALGNIFANIIKLGASGGLKSDKQLLAVLLEEVDINHSEIASIRAAIFKEIEKAKIFLEISSRG
jgi:putative nucleotidyltransferase with HDIG domain